LGQAGYDEPYYPSQARHCQNGASAGLPEKGHDQAVA